jgi:hypothetical protein
VGIGRIGQVTRLWPVLLALAAGPVRADGDAADGDWLRLTGPDVAAALTARTLAYQDGAVQDFRAGGTTTYTADSPSAGRWRVEGDRYCSQWPPSDRWACYDLDRSADGLDLRFVADDGSSTVGRYADLQ